MLPTSQAAFLLLLFDLCSRHVSGSYPQAKNVTWKSTNFKTILRWEPKPSADYSYTVEYSELSGDKQRNSHCIRSSVTWCDLSSSLTPFKSCYTADVLSEPPLGASSDLIEFPHTSSPRFCPYKDTDIGKPDFKLKVSEDKKKTILYVEDPLTALFEDGHQLNIRDIFSDQLQYRVTYRRNKSTGKKVYNSKSNVIELTDLDRGESYCFNVQAYLPSRSAGKQLGELSHTQCSKDDSKSIFDGKIDNKTTFYITVILYITFYIILCVSFSLLKTFFHCY
ncbi:coagulation factor IIIa isoform X2 [Brachionichthys hirsutus]|uniref:coagulation factor IIIa isoform X2 n=1 Tax=Brachionichthys hirsutus TaxID=412623 RepID=UPI0036051992